MEYVLEQIQDWLRGVLVDGCLTNLSYLFSSVNAQVGSISTQVGTSPANFSPAIFNMIKSLSETVIMPIAGIILTFIACYELIQLVVAHNNLANFETWIFFKWIFKTFVAVLLITNTFDITMGIFDLAGEVVASSGELLLESTSVDVSGAIDIGGIVGAMELPELIGLFVQSLFINICTYVIAVAVFVIVYGRMIEIYLMVSLAPIPLATFGNREQSQIGQNYIRSLFALGFQGFLIMVCVGIYSVMIKSIAISGDIISGLWSVLGYTVLLAFTLFKTGSVAKSILHAH